MRVHSFGEAGLPTVVLIHGLATTWRQIFGEIIPLLSVRYHVIPVSLSGHVPTDPEDFVSRKGEARELALHLRREGTGTVHGVFGASLGAAVAVELACSGQVQIGGAFPGYGHGEILKHPQQFFAELTAFLEHAEPAASP